MLYSEKRERCSTKRKTILFDLDGTLTDSAEGIINSVILALEHFNLPVPDKDAMRVFVGPPLIPMLINHGVPEDKANEALQIFRSRYTTVGKYENAPYPGVLALLQNLKEGGHTLFVATSKPEPQAMGILEHFQLAPYFDIICGASLDETRATKEDVIEYLLTQYSSTDNMVMVGDTVYDIHGANAHGIPAIGVAWGYGDIADMENAGAIAIAHSVHQLQELLDA